MLAWIGVFSPLYLYITYTHTPTKNLHLCLLNTHCEWYLSLSLVFKLWKKLGFGYFIFNHHTRRWRFGHARVLCKRCWCKSHFNISIITHKPKVFERSNMKTYKLQIIIIKTKTMHYREVALLLYIFNLNLSEHVCVYVVSLPETKSFYLIKSKQSPTARELCTIKQLAVVSGWQQFFNQPASPPQHIFN